MLPTINNYISRRIFKITMGGLNKPSVEGKQTARLEMNRKRAVHVKMHSPLFYLNPKDSYSITPNARKHFVNFSTA